MHQNHNLSKHRKVTGDRFETYKDLCDSFIALTSSRKCENFFSYLQAFSNIDKVDIVVESESETASNSESE